MEITNSLEVPLPPDEAWRLLLDIPRIMPCVPGAELLETLDDNAYKGKVSVRLGPVALSFVGTAKFEEMDAAAKRARVSAKGSDAKGRGGADAVVQFHLEPAGDGTKVSVLTNVNLSGSVAQYGRGTGIIQGVASQLTAQFAQNLKAMLERGEVEDDEPEPEAPPAPAAAAVPPAAEPAQAPATPAMPAAAAQPAGDAGMPVAGAAVDGAALARAEAAAARAEAAAARVEAAVGRVEAAITRVEATATALKKAVRPPSPPMPQAKPISGFSLMLSVIWASIVGLFSSKKNV